MAKSNKPTYYKILSVFGKNGEQYVIKTRTLCRVFTCAVFSNCLQIDAESCGCKDDISQDCIIMGFILKYSAEPHKHFNY